MCSVALSPSIMGRITLTVVRSPVLVAAWRIQGDTVKRFETKQAWHRSRDMRKEDGRQSNVLRTIARVVCHTHVTPICQPAVANHAEEIGVGRVATAHSRTAIGSRSPADNIAAMRFQYQRKAVSQAKLAGCHVTTPRFRCPRCDPIVNTVRNQHAIGPVGKS